MSVCQYVNMSICHNATFQLRYQNESCSKCHQEKVVKRFEREREWEWVRVRKSERERKRKIKSDREKEWERERVRDKRWSEWERESERKSGRGWERVGEGGRVREWESENLYGQLKSPLLFLSFFKFSDFYLGISSMNSKLSRWGWGKNKSGLFRCPAILSYCHFVSLFVWHSKEPLF